MNRTKTYTNHVLTVPQPVLRTATGDRRTHQNSMDEIVIFTDAERYGKHDNAEAKKLFEQLLPHAKRYLVRKSVYNLENNPDNPDNPFETFVEQKEITMSLDVEQDV